MTSAAVIGAGLAGCEAAWQLARLGINVKLVDMKPARLTPAHSSGLFSELVCSNSLKSDEIHNASGLLKAEMRRFHSLILEAADATRVRAGSALAVDREKFAEYVTSAIRNNPRVTIVSDEAISIPDPPAIIATGPLTSDALSSAIEKLPGLARLSFYDAAAPIITAESIDQDKVFTAARYGKGDSDYINCPLSESEYDAFREELLFAATAPIHGFESRLLYEGCMPVEAIAQRGRLSLAYGPMRPVGLIDPKTGRRPFAIVQLRMENGSGTLWNMVGFQTRLTFPEQLRVFGMIPGLENAQFARYGVMHRNTFIDAPSALDSTFMVASKPGLFIAGQLTGVEGYLPSAASGMIAGIHLARKMRGLSAINFPTNTALGALGRYVSTKQRDYQPMGIQYGIIDAPDGRFRDKRAKAELVAKRSLESIDLILQTLEAGE